jgi:hypothetical protein
LRAYHCSRFDARKCASPPFCFLLACLFISVHLPLKFFAAGRKQETEREANTQRPRERFQSLVAGAQFDARQDTGV